MARRFSLLLAIGAVLAVGTRPALAGWRQVSALPEENFLSLFFLDENTGFAGSWGGGLFRTQDGGNHWERLEVGLGLDWVNAIRFADDRNGIAVTSEGTILTTSDGGLSWSSRTFPDTGFKGLWILDARTAWAVGRKGTIVVTHDGGDTWQPQKAPTTTLLLDVHFPSQETGFAVGAEGTVLRTRDGGRNWTKLESGTSAILYSVWFLNPSVGWIGGRDGTFLWTRNGGDSFTKVSCPSAAEIDAIEFADENEGWAVGGRLGGKPIILHTTDGGNSWQEEQSPVALNWWQSLSVVSSRTVFIGGNGGVLIKR